MTLPPWTPVAPWTAMIFDMMLDLLVVWNWKCPGTRYITVEVWEAFRYELMMSEYEKKGDLLDVLYIH